MAKRILVVEDNDLNRKLFCDVLKSQGYATEPVSDGRDALDKARAFGPDLIIMDIQLPNISGLDLIQAAKRDAVLRAIPVLAVTAYAGRGDEDRIRDAGGRRLPGKAGVDRALHGGGACPAGRVMACAGLDIPPPRRFCAAISRHQP